MRAELKLLLWLALTVSGGISWRRATAAEAASENAHEDANSDVIEDDFVRPVAKTITLDDHCTPEGVCRGFQYGQLDEVAYFELRPAVRITDAATYDIIENKTNYQKLVFENCTFAVFPLHLFAAVPVEELDMRNCSVQLLYWENFLLTQDLRILLLSDNKLGEIRRHAFTYAADLQFLFLDHNEIESLHALSFAGLGKLHYLDLSHNRLAALPDNVWRHLPQLQELNLAHNRLRVISNDLLASIPRLRFLNVEANALEEIGEEAFRVQKYLDLLALSHNRPLTLLVINLDVRHIFAANCSLSRVNLYGLVQNVDMRDNRIQELYFSQPQALAALCLRNNALQDIASLTRATQLRVLDLADNPGLSISYSSEYWAAAALERLDLSNTSMERWTLSLDSLSSLRILNVSHNHLKEIHPDSFRELRKLTNFYIHGNDWNCFNLRMIVDMLLRPHGITYTRDTFDPQFPGEYILGIACMYRIEEQEQQLDPESTISPVEQSANLVAASSGDEQSLQLEVDKLRREMKTISGFYEARLDKAFGMISDLDARLLKFEKENKTMWQHITITT